MSKNFIQTQENNEYRFIEPTWLNVIAENMTTNAKKYPNETWRGIPPEEHAARALRHLNLYRQGDTSENHLANASVRCMMAFETDRKRKFQVPKIKLQVPEIMTVENARKENFAEEWANAMNGKAKEEKIEKKVVPPLPAALNIAIQVVELLLTEHEEVSEGQKLDIEEALDHLKAAHDNDYDDDDEIEDCIEQLEDLKECCEELVDTEDADEKCDDDVYYLEMAIKIIKDWKQMKNNQ